jgi:hypothetical protein
MKSIPILLLCLTALSATAQDGPLREARGPKLVAPAELGNWWVLDTKSQRALPTRDAADDAPGCATAQFLIDSEGHPSTIEVVRSQPQGKYDKALRRFLERAHYNVSPQNAEGDAVHTYTTLVWGAADAAARDVLAQPCALDAAP